MSVDTITHLIIVYRYWILIPLCFLEGPIVAFVAGTLASLGYFNVFLLGGIFFVRDVLTDAFMYFVGRYGGKTRLATWFFKKVGVTNEHLESVYRLWEKNTGKTMFFSKISYGLAATFLVVAGLVEVSMYRFFLWAAIVTVMQYGVLLTLGYYFGSAFGTVSTVLNNLGYVVGGITLFITGYYLLTHFMRRRLLNQEKEVEQEVEEQAQ
jgi:membrane protein DedA with SNARE-associated domain